jgi:hypothetical protein
MPDFAVSATVHDSGFMFDFDEGGSVADPKAWSLDRRCVSVVSPIGAQVSRTAAVKAGHHP